MLKIIRRRQKRKQFVNTNMCTIARYFGKQNNYDSEEYDEEFDDFIIKESNGKPWNIEAGKFMFLCIRFNYFDPFEIVMLIHSFLWTMDFVFLRTCIRKNNKLYFVKYMIEKYDNDDEIVEDMLELSINYDNTQVTKYLLNYLQN